MAKQISTARKVGRVIKSILKLVLAFVLAALMAAGNLVLPGFSRMGNSFLGGYSQSWDNSKVNTAGLDLDYNKADYDSESIKDAEKDLDRRLAAEGVVLAQNDGDALPLAKGTKLSFFGANSRTLGSAQSMLTAATGGSSSSSAALNAALEAHGLSANTTLQEFYSEGAGKDYVQGAGSVSFGDAEDFRLNECPISVMQDAGVLDSAKDTTPVFVMKRVAGEGRDAPRSMYNHADSAEDKVKNYLEPDSTELQILQYINDNFDNGIVLVNSAVVVELDWLAQFPNIRACLLVLSVLRGSAESSAISTRIPARGSWMTAGLISPMWWIRRFPSARWSSPPPAGTGCSWSGRLAQENQCSPSACRRSFLHSRPRSGQRPFLSIRSRDSPSIRSRGACGRFARPITRSRSADLLAEGDRCCQESSRLRTKASCSWTSSLSSPVTFCSPCGSRWKIGR